MPDQLGQMLLDEADRELEGVSIEPPVGAQCVAGEPHHRARRQRWMLSAAAVIVVVAMGGAIGWAVSRGGNVVKTSPAESVDGETKPEPTVAPDPDPTDDELAAFCAADQELDKADGNEEEAAVLRAVAEVRRTAPLQIRGDVNLLLDSFVINRFPAAADLSMTEAPATDLTAAEDTVNAYREENCGHG